MLVKNSGGNGWPPKHSVFGVAVSATTCAEALDAVMRAAKRRESACVSHLAVHGLITAAKDPFLRARLRKFEIVAPDGAPVKSALNLLHHTHLPGRVAGPDFMLQVCERAATEGVGIYLYGSRPHVVGALRRNLSRRFPTLGIAGWEPSVFRPLAKEEDEALVQRINDSGAGIVFVGLGCPLQENFAYAHRKRVKAVQICVGAAFDFHSGNRRRAPRWMQQCALEWLHRLLQERGRLWRRYFVTNMAFISKLILQLGGLKEF